MTRLWLVRHGPTHAKNMVGWTDLPADLSDTAAINRLSAHLPDAPIVSSDLSRAIATADAIQGERPRLPHHSGLREIHFGDWEMATFSDDPHMRAFWETPGDISAPNGESWNDVRARANNAIDEHLSLGHPDLIVVAHFGMILTQVQRALGCSAYETFGHRIENLSVTTIDTTTWDAVAINHKP